MVPRCNLCLFLPPLLWLVLSAFLSKTLSYDRFPNPIASRHLSTIGMYVPLEMADVTAEGAEVEGAGCVVGLAVITTCSSRVSLGHSHKMPHEERLTLDPGQCPQWSWLQ